jgi:hypothetical protein
MASSAAIAILRNRWAARDKFASPILDVGGRSSAHACSRLRVWKISGGSVYTYCRPSH